MRWETVGCRNQAWKQSVAGARGRSQRKRCSPVGQRRDSAVFVGDVIQVPEIPLQSRQMIQLSQTRSETAPIVSWNLLDLFYIRLHGVESQRLICQSVRHTQRKGEVAEFFILISAESCQNEGGKSLEVEEKDLFGDSDSNHSFLEPTILPLGGIPKLGATEMRALLPSACIGSTARLGLRRIILACLA